MPPIWSALLRGVWGQLTNNGNFAWRGKDLNLRPLGYEPSELPNCYHPAENYYNTKKY